MILYIERVTMEDGTYTNVYADGFRITNDEKSVRYYFVDLCKKTGIKEKTLAIIIASAIDKAFEK